MKRALTIAAIATIIDVGILLSPGATFGQTQETLHACQKAARKETAKYVQQYIQVVSSCMDAISKEVILKGLPTEGAAAKCQSAFAKLLNTSKPEATLTTKLAAKIEKSCAPPPSGTAAHTEADILGTSGAGEDLSVINLDGYCGDFGGDGAVDDLAGWISCLSQAGTCAARESLAVAYPRLLEWLRRIQLDVAALDPTCDLTCSVLCTDPAVIDACNAIQAVAAAIDGTPVDEQPDIACGPARGARPAAALQTGEAICHDDTGAVIACAGTGQDGETLLGVARNFEFDNTVPAERTVIDHSTGLEWEVQCDEDPFGVQSKCPTLHDVDTLFTWTHAFAKIALLNDQVYAGHNDWRLPNINELLTLANYGTFPAFYPDFFFTTGCSITDSMTPCSVSECSCSNPALWYLSSTSAASNPQGSWVFLPLRWAPVPPHPGG